MYVEILGGLTSRFWVLASVCHFDQANLKPVWNQAPVVRANFDDLFVNNLEVLQDSMLNIDELNFKNYGSPTHIFLKSESSQRTHKVTEHIGIERLMDFRESGYDNSTYLLADQPMWGWVPTNETYDLFRHFMSMLVLVPEIQDQVDKYCAMFSDSTIGVNIRGCENSINNTPNANRFTITKAESCIKMEIKKDNNVNIFLTSGNEENLIYLSSKFGERIIYVKEPNSPLDVGESLDGVKRALVDWYLLSKTPKAYIPLSGYAIKACEMSRTPYQIVR